MANENVLIEREFDIPHKGQSYKVKAVAVFVTHGYNLMPHPEEQGLYHIDFTFRGQHAGMWQPDKTQYSREQAKRAAESGFTSGQIETFAETWLAIGL